MTIYSKKLILGLSALVIFPWPTLAFSASNFSSLVSGIVSSLIYPLGTVLVSLAVVYFIWNTIKFIRAEDKQREDARQGMIYGLIGLTIMVSFWGLIALLQNTAGLNNGSSVRDQIQGVYNRTGGGSIQNSVFDTGTVNDTRTQFEKNQSTNSGTTNWYDKYF